MSARHTMIDFEKLEDAPQLLDLLVQMEAVLDDLDIYVYRNWFDGEVVEGPVVTRHFLSMSLLYPHHKMPDPRACLRLLKHGVMVEFSRVQQASADPDQSASGMGVGRDSSGPGNDRDVDEDGDDEVDEADAPDEPAKPTFWMVKVTFPRRLLDQMNTDDLDVYGDDVDGDDVEDAKDSGMTDEDAYTADPNATPGGPMGDPMGGDPMAADPTAAPPMGGMPNG